MRALPYTYRSVDADDGSAIVFHISGKAGGAWSLLRRNGAWSLYSGQTSTTVATVRLDQDVAWRLFTKGMSRAAVRDRMDIEGDASLGTAILQMVSIMV